MCGNGVVDGGEACDDGNAFAGDGCENDCTISTACTFVHPGIAGEVFVNDTPANDGVGAPAACASALFTTIQAAINSVSVGDGDIVSVCPGTYTENVSLSKEITLRSTNGAATTIVQSSGVVIDLLRSGVSIEGLHIEAAGGTAIGANSICPLGSSGCVQPGRGSNVRIAGNEIASSATGIGWQRKVDCVAIQNNAITGNAAQIDIAQAGGAPAVLVIVMQNNISGGGSAGQSVRLSGLGVLALFSGNTVDGSAAHGLVVADIASGPVIRENNISNNTNNGIVMLPGTAGVRVLQNNITGNGIGLSNEATEGVVNATLNWWGSQTGPLHATDRPLGLGDEIVEINGGIDTDFIEFLCAPAPGGFPSVAGVCGAGEPTEEINFIAVGREPDVSPNGRFITFVSDRDLNGDAGLTVNNGDGGDEVFLLNRKPTGKPVSFCLGGASPGAVCERQRDCPADFDADPIVTDGVCVLLTQLSNDASGSAISFTPRVTRSGNVFFATDANLLGSNADGSKEVHRWDRRAYRKTAPTDPNSVLDVFTAGAAGVESGRPAPDRGGRRKVVMESATDPLGTNADGNTEIFVFDSRKNIWSQITDTTGADNRRPSTLNGRQILFDSDGNLTGGNPDGNREIYFARFKGQQWAITQITDTLGVENRAGNLSRRGKTLIFTSNGNFTGNNPDGNREVFVWDKGTMEQITNTTVGENVNPHSNPRGRFVVFESTADVEDGGSGATLTNRRVHLFDRKFGKTLVISRSFFGENFLPRMSQGRFVVWESTANLTGQNPSSDKAVYLFDRRKDD